MYPVIHLGSELSLPTYYLALRLAVCISLFWLVSRAKAKHCDQREVLDLAFFILVFGFIGARLFHVFYEEPAHYFAQPGRIFQFWNGGFVYYGGAVFGTAAGTLFYFYGLKHKKDELGRYLDLFAPIGSLSYLLGRGGCFLAGCCYGKFCDLPWALDGRHPTQLYAVIWELGTLLIILTFEKTTRISGRVFSLWIFLHGLGRLLMEAFRDDFRGPEWGLSISSWISILLVLFGVWLHQRATKLFKSY